MLLYVSNFSGVVAGRFQKGYAKKKEKRRRSRMPCHPITYKQNRKRNFQLGISASGTNALHVVVVKMRRKEPTGLMHYFSCR
jgi:hypothetical protein